MSSHNEKKSFPDSPPHVPLDSSSSDNSSENDSSNKEQNTEENQENDSNGLSSLKISIVETPQKYTEKKTKKKLHFGKSRPATQQNGPGESTPNSPTEPSKTMSKLGSIGDLSVTPDVNVVKMKSKPKTLQSLIFDAILVSTTEELKYVTLTKITRYVLENCEENEKEAFSKLINKTLSKMVNKKYLKIKNLSAFKLTKEGQRALEN